MSSGTALCWYDGTEDTGSGCRRGDMKCCGGIMAIIILRFSFEVAQYDCTFNNVTAVYAVDKANKQH